MRRATNLGQPIGDRGDNWLNNGFHTVPLRKVTDPLLPCHQCRFAVANSVDDILGLATDGNLPYPLVQPLCSIRVPDRRVKVVLDSDQTGGHNIRFAHPFMMTSREGQVYICPSYSSGKPREIPIVWWDYTGSGVQLDRFDSRDPFGAVGAHPEGDAYR